MKKAVLKNFAIFTGKLQTCNCIKKRLQHNYYLTSEYWELFKNTCFQTSANGWINKPEANRHV